MKTIRVATMLAIGIATAQHTCMTGVPAARPPVLHELIITEGYPDDR